MFRFHFCKEIYFGKIYWLSFVDMICPSQKVSLDFVPLSWWREENINSKHFRNIKLIFWIKIGTQFTIKSCTYQPWLDNNYHVWGLKHKRVVFISIYFHFHFFVFEWKVKNIKNFFNMKRFFFWIFPLLQWILSNY
jgi:hypothetical protein